jgi:hypothetical protein
MSSYKYWLIKRSIDLEVIKQRKSFISDVATAFSDPKKGVTNLEKQEKLMEQMYNSMINRKITIDGQTSAVNWDFPDDSADKMKRWQR